MRIVGDIIRTLLFLPSLGWIAGWVAILPSLVGVGGGLLLASCTDDTIGGAESGDAELHAIHPTMSRAVEVAPLADYVGRSEFDDQDRIVFTSIQRSDDPIDAFSYKNIEFVCSVTTDNEGHKGTGWSRDPAKGSTVSSTTSSTPDRIYWTDATSEHTFIGYCTPQQEEDKVFDWTITLDPEHHATGDYAYYGSIGDPKDGNTTIDFTSTFDNEGKLTHDGNDVLRQNDILLTHSKEVKAKDAVADLQFYHGLAQVRVIVDISEFAASGKDDTKAIVSDMVLNNMLTLYKWKMANPQTQCLVDADNTVMGTLFGTGTTINYNQRKNFKLWIPNPNGVGEGANKTFTFYGLAVPSQISSESPLLMDFNVTYPDPMKPTENKTHEYKAQIANIHFDAGKCTTIHISLNHRYEKLTVGAQYDDWEFKDIPDHSVLKKHTTFLESSSRDSVSILGDEKANMDDATWLYLEKDAQDRPYIVDVYGNKGTRDNPFVIKYAYQFLSLAYEVNGTGRKAFSYYPPGATTPTEVAIGQGLDFKDFYIDLQAGQYLQPALNTPSDKQVDWPGIGIFVGDNNAANRPFNGTLIGGVRLINLLRGKPLFGYVGPYGHVDQLLLEDVISCSGNAAYVEVNEGLICAAKVGSTKVNNQAFDITGNNRYQGNSPESQSTTAPDGVYIGAFCARNDGILNACYSTAHINATRGDYVSGFVGLNNGLLICCYSGSTVQAKAEGVGRSGATFYGIAAGAGQGQYTNAESQTAWENCIFKFCVYDCDQNTTTHTELDNTTPPVSDNLKNCGAFYNRSTSSWERAPGIRAVTTSFLKSRSIIGEQNSTANPMTFNGTFATLKADPSTLGEHAKVVYTRLDFTPTTFADHVGLRYYVPHIAEYPWVY